MPNKKPPPGAIEIQPANLPSISNRQKTATTIQPGGTKRPAITPWVISFLIIGAATWAFLTIRPVAVTTTPTASNLHLEGSWAWRSGDTWYLTAGKWQATAELEGYEKLNAPFTVSRTGVNSFNFDLAPLPGYVSVSAIDANSKQTITDASVTIDDKPHEPELPIKMGDAQIRVTHPDYLPATQSITIRGLGERQSSSISLIPKHGVLTIPKLPNEAVVQANAKRIGSGPGSWELEPGKKHIRITSAGKQPWETDIEIESGKETVINEVDLQPIPATVRFESHPPGAQISLDEALAGVAPFTRTLSPGVYAGRAVLPGYHPADLLVELHPGDKVTHTFILNPLTGKITIQAPEGSEILVDNKPWTAPMPAELPIGMHHIEVRMPGAPPAIRPVVIRADREATLTFKLPKKTQPTEPPKPPIPTKAPLPYGIKSIRIAAPKEPFRIGSPRSERHRRSNEAQRTVQLTRAFELSTTEITNAQYRNLMPTHTSGAGLNADNQPVVDVSWDDAARFCNHLNEKLGLPMTYKEQGGKMVAVRPMEYGWRLPTESEWALTARLTAPQGAIFPWGSTTKPKKPHYNLADETVPSNRKLEGYTDKHAKSAPVMSFPADKLGLFDLAGNVSEWCHDYYSLSTPNPSRVEIDPSGPKSGIHHIIRGSNFNHYKPERLRIALRDYSSSKRSDVGFRICRFAPKETK